MYDSLRPSAFSYIFAMAGNSAMRLWKAFSCGEGCDEGRGGERVNEGGVDRER